MRLYYTTPVTKYTSNRHRCRETGGAGALIQHRLFQAGAADGHHRRETGTAGALIQHRLFQAGAADGQSRKPLSPIETYDPLARFLTRTLRLSPFGFGLLVFVADVLVDGWLGWHYDVFVISSATIYELRQGTLLAAYPVLAGIAAYVVFAPLYFSWPLGTAHRAMREAKDDELLRLARQFDAVYDQVKQGITDRGDWGRS